MQKHLENIKSEVEGKKAADASNLQADRFAFQSIPRRPALFPTSPRGLKQVIIGPIGLFLALPSSRFLFLAGPPPSQPPSLSRCARSAPRSQGCMHRATVRLFCAAWLSPGR